MSRVFIITIINYFCEDNVINIIVAIDLKQSFLMASIWKEKLSLIKTALKYIGLKDNNYLQNNYNK